MMRVATWSFALVLLGVGVSRAQSMPVCVYDSRTFSEGAHICVQKDLMLACTQRESRPLWTVVADHELSAHCLAPMQGDGDSSARLRRRHIASRAQERLATPAAAPGCFVFNGKRYCE